MARMVRRPSARTATLVTTHMPVRRTDTGDLTTSWAACSSESVRGMDGDSVTDFTVTADSVADFMMVTDLIVVGSLDAGSTADQDLEIGQASPTAAALAALPEADFAAAAAALAALPEADFAAAAVASTEVAAVSMAAVVVGSTEVAADMGVATGN
jgi:hypothetical protein